MAGLAIITEACVDTNDHACVDVAPCSASTSTTRRRTVREPRRLHVVHRLLPTRRVPGGPRSTPTSTSPTAARTRSTTRPTRPRATTTRSSSNSPETSSPTEVIDRRDEALRTDSVAPRHPLTMRLRSTSVAVLERLGRPADRASSAVSGASGTRPRTPPPHDRSASRAVDSRGRLVVEHSMGARFRPHGRATGFDRPSLDIRGPRGGADSAKGHRSPGRSAPALARAAVPASCSVHRRPPSEHQAHASRCGSTRWSFVRPRWRPTVGRRLLARGGLRWSACLLAGDLLRGAWLVHGVAGGEHGERARRWDYRCLFLRRPADPEERAGHRRDDTVAVGPFVDDSRIRSPTLTMSWHPLCRSR